MNYLPILSPSQIPTRHTFSSIDLQVIKAAGVTFAASMLERVIEEQAGGDAQKAQSIREVVQGVIGDNLKQSNLVLKKRYNSKNI